MEDNNQLILVNLFRQIMTNNPVAVHEATNIYGTNPSLLARKIKFSCGATSDIADTGCSCVLDHETFTYICDNKVDIEILDYILKSVESGRCRHYSCCTGPQPTAVNLIHAAAAVSYVSVLEILLKVHKNKPPLTYTLCASPLHLAILHKQSLSIKTIIGAKGCNLDRYCDFFRFERRNKRNPNIVDCDHFSTFKLCSVMNDLSTAESIIRYTSLRAHWVIDAMTGNSEEALNMTLRYIDGLFIKRLSEYQAHTIVKYAICKGLTQLVHMIILKRRTHSGASLALLATVYNEPKLLQLILKSKADKGKIKILNYTLLDISDTLGHKECSDILKCHGVKRSKTNPASPFLVMLEIGAQVPFHETTDILIRKVADQIPLYTRLEGGETLITHSLRYKHGLGIRTLLTVGCNVEERGFDGLTPVGLLMKPNTHPCSVLDIMYFNPSLSSHELNDNLQKSDIFSDFPEMRDVQKSRNISILTIAVVRDLTNYSVIKRDLGQSGFAIYEGSLSVLLIDCGYDVRSDELIHSSYYRILEKKTAAVAYGHARENEIRKRILDRIHNELYHPKPLKVRCRDVIRGKFTGQNWLRFFRAVEMPASVRNYIMLESRLNPNPRRCRFHTDCLICNIEEG